MQPTGNRPFAQGRGSSIAASIALVALLLVMMIPGAGASHSSVSAGPTAPAATSARGSVQPGASIAPLSVQNATGSFYGFNSSFANLAPGSSQYCQQSYSNSSFSTYHYQYKYLNCIAGAQNPSLFDLHNGNLGVSYETYLHNDPYCANFSSYTVSRVGFQVSSTGGRTWGPAQYFGNQTCAYLQAIEPSFASSSNGDIFGTFVEENLSDHGNSSINAAPTNYWNRTNEMLGFVMSGNNGTSFTNVTQILPVGTSNFARPQMAVYGDTIYVVYDQLDNSTAINLSMPSYPQVPTAHPEAVKLVYSSNGGTSWNGPYTLPGLNATAGYDARSPEVTVNATGAVAVGYLTGRACYELYFGFCDYYGDHPTVAVSTSNGTTWSSPVEIGWVGENRCAGYDNNTWGWYNCYAYQFQTGPQVTITWSDTAPSTLYAAWSGLYIYMTIYGYIAYGQGGIFSAASSNGGATWTNSTVIAPQYTTGYDDDYHYDPSITAHAGTIYLQYALQNESFCFGIGCSPYAEVFSYWMTTSANGLVWTNPSLLEIDTNPVQPIYYYETTDYWGGYTDAIINGPLGITASWSEPNLTYSAFTFGFNYSNGNYYYYYNYSDVGQSELTVAFPYSGPTVVVNVSENGLPAGDSWSFGFGASTFTSTNSTVSITNVPLGTAELFVPSSAVTLAGFWAYYAPLTTTPSIYTFNSNGNITLQYPEYFGVQFLFNPSSMPYIDFYFNLPSGASYSYYTNGVFSNIFPTAFPWYIPAHTVVHIDSTSLYSAVPPAYFSGTGNGSSTVYGNTTQITVNAPINETMWFGAFSVYTVTFHASGLPAGATYSFTFDGATHTATAGHNVTVTGVLTGAYTVSNIVANSSVSGWEYFGQVPGGDLIIIPVSPVVDLDYSYAYVDLGAAPGSISFHAQGLAPGDVWEMSFNGTNYSSNTPWVNVTTHPGTFRVAANPILASENNSVAYAPRSFGPLLSVTVGSTYNITYLPAYHVQVTSGAGGSVTGAGSSWLAPGTLASYVAHVNANYAFGGWVGTGAGSYTGMSLTANVTVNGPITEAANFIPLPANRFNLTFTETGLPTATWWTVNLGGVGYTTNQATLTVAGLYACSAGAPGQYTVAVPDAFLNGSSGTRFVPGGYPATTCTTGTTNVPLSFVTQYLVTPISGVGGTAYMVVSTVPTSNPAWVASGTTVGLEQTTISTGYSFVAWSGTGPGSYSGPNPTTTFTPTGPVTETATFAAVLPPPIPTYTISVHETTGLVAGTSWGFTLLGTAYASATAWLNVSGLLNGTYTLVYRSTLSPDHLTQYNPSIAQSSVQLTSSGQLVTLAFKTLYWVSESAGDGGSLVSATNGFVAAGQTVTLNASPSAGHTFVGWSGTGASSYSGLSESVSVVVTSPITEVAAFAPVPPTSTTSSSGVNLTSPVLLAGLAGLGLVVGLLVGYVAFRRRGHPPSSGNTSGGSA